MISIDCHAHVFTSDAPSIPVARYRPAYEASLADWAALWPTAGVEAGVRVQPSFCGTDNTEMLAAIGQSPKTLRGVAVVDADVREEDLARMARAAVRAIRLNLAGVA